LVTERLVLRPTEPADVERALEIRSNHEVARNLVSATIPPDREKMTNWFACHAEEWHEGTAYRLAVTLEGRLIGVCDIFDVDRSEGEIGYWLDRAVWGRGFGLEAAKRLVRFAVEAGRVRRRQRRFSDDHHEGFTRLEDSRVYSRSREEEITQRRFRLTV
jgi:ribosomal-protein-alanine N-acetyltransferase